MHATFCLIKIILLDWEKIKQEEQDGANRSLEFKHGIIQIVCAVENQSESAWALTNIILGNTCLAKISCS